MTELFKDFVSLIAYWVERPFRREKPVVLVYHSVDRIPAEADPLKLNVPPELFERQMAELARRKAPSLITFDDGYGGVYTHAFPILRRHRLPAILFLPTDTLDGKRSFQGHFTDSQCPSALTWEQAKEMADQGVELGSHSMSHRDLAPLDDASLLAEVRGSRQRIQEATGHRVEAFSYPYGNAGSVTPRVEKALKEAGYRRAYVNRMGSDNSAREPFRIRRIRVYPTDAGPRFRRKLAGAYDWVDALLAFWPARGRRFSRDLETGPGLNPVTESLWEEARRNPYPKEHTHPYWQAEGERLEIRRQRNGLSLKGFGVATSERRGIAWETFHALERASYRGVTARLRSYGETWAALKKLARDLSIRISYDVWKSAVIAAVLADHWERHRLSPQTFAMIGDGSGVLGALIRRIRPGCRMFCIDLPKALTFQSYLLSRAEPRARLSRIPDAAGAGADVVFVLPQQIGGVPDTIDCAVNIASMQEMSAFQIRSYFQFLRKRSRAGSHFYCVNRKEKKLPGGECSRLADYPWQPVDRIFLDGPCPYYTHTLSRCMRPSGPRWMGVRIPFVNAFDGPMAHRLVHLEGAG